jgi:hypothetical protein
MTAKDTMLWSYEDEDYEIDRILFKQFISLR